MTKIQSLSKYVCCPLSYIQLLSQGGKRSCLYVDVTVYALGGQTGTINCIYFNDLAVSF